MRPGLLVTFVSLMMLGADLALAQGQEEAKPERIGLWNKRAPLGDGKFQETEVWMTVHRPAKPNGTAVVICPGGGYGGLVTGAEGHGIATWLKRHGITGVVLEYRLPGGRAQVPLLDAQRSVRIVRANAKTWKLDPERIGIMGFSAGGHLASTAGTHFDAGEPDSADPVQRVSCRPDFMILVYPVITMGEKGNQGSRNNLLGKNPEAKLVDLYSNEKQVTAKTPPTFLAHAKDDRAVPPENSRLFYEALRAHKVPADYLELPSGGHGLDGHKGPMWDTWQERSLSWLVETKLVPTEARREASHGKPNLVIILADDMGYSDLGCYGGEIKSPVLDKLAQNGVRFVQFYNTPRCCPSRAALMTGLYSHQTGIGNMTADQKLPGYRGNLSGRCVTIAQVLRLAGYRTLMIGKWHLGVPGPIAHGFDEYFGILGGFDSLWNPKAYVRLPKGRPSRTYAQGKFFATDSFTDYAFDFLADARKRPEQPWFLYLAYTAPHFPLHAHEEDIAKYETLYQKGWDKIREERYDRQKKLKIIDPRWPLSPRSDYVHKFSGEQRPNPAWDSLDSDRQKDLARRMAVYAAMIDRMDRNIGRLVEDLAKHKQLDNTLVCFLSDNGGSAEWDHLGFDNKSGPENILHKGDDLKKVGGPASYVSAGSGWGNAQKTPFRWYKHHCYEGGVCTPFIAHWPARIRSPGELRHQVGHLIDLMPTCVEVAETKFPETFEGKKLLPLEGTSLIPAFDNRAVSRAPLFWEHEGNRAVRDGKWKLVANSGQPWELYDLEADRVESKNLAKTHAERAEAMAKQWHAWAVRAQVYPSPFLGDDDDRTPKKKKAAKGK